LLLEETITATTRAGTSFRFALVVLFDCHVLNNY
jgi:hypothetical protein